jgi:Family of unknown function (DUF6502)
MSCIKGALSGRGKLLLPLVNIFIGKVLSRCISRSDSAQRSKISKAAAIQDAARKSITNLLRHLSAFVLDCGLSISELNSLLRTAAVQRAAMRQLEDNARVNISGIAAITGIPRAEVSQLLKSTGSLTIGTIKRRQNITNKILSAWHDDPHFLAAGGYPRDLPIFGDGATFEHLVRKYGQGIPIRAIIDELERAGAIQLLTSSQKIHPKMPKAINLRITVEKIKEFDATVNALFPNLQSPSDAAFIEKKVFGTRVWSGTVSELRRRLGPNATALLEELRRKLAIKQAKHRRKETQKVAHLSVTIVYKEVRGRLAKVSMKTRRNFSRIT